MATGGDSRTGRGSALDVCLISTAPGGLSALEHFLRETGCRPVVTTPTRLPNDSDWDAYDLVLVDWSPEASGFPEVPSQRANLVLATCLESELRDPDVLRAALRAGARDILPRSPSAHWRSFLDRARTPTTHAALRFLDPASQVERIFRIERDEVTIGRDPSSDIVFPQPFISRLHCRIEQVGTRSKLVDAESRLGTFVNDERVREHILGESDRIRLGAERGPELTFTRVTKTEGTLYLESHETLDQHPVNREVHDIAGLLETFLSLDSDLLLDEVIELLLDRVITFVHADRGVVMLRPWRPHVTGKLSLDTLEVSVCRDRKGHDLPTESLDINYRVINDVLRDVRGTLHEETVRDEDGRLRMQSSLCVPLKVRGKLLDNIEGPTVVGVLYVDSVTRSRPFSPRTLDTLEVLAAEVAMAVHTTSLYEDSLKRRRVEEELAIAREIQNNIFREQRHSGRVWQFHGTTSPSHEVGGDLLSCWQVGESRFSVVVGDVSGKGVPAALFSTMLDGLFFGMAEFDVAEPDLVHAADKLNEFIVSKSRLTKFVTSIFGILDETGRFAYINAGHNPGFVLRRSGLVEELETSGTILGMFEQPSYRPYELTLEAGETVLLFTDGIPEARNARGESFGVARLHSLAAELVGRSPIESVQSMHEEILRQVSEFSGGEANQKDDVTLLVIRRTAEAEEPTEAQQAAAGD